MSASTIPTPGLVRLPYSTSLLPGCRLLASAPGRVLRPLLVERAGTLAPAAVGLFTIKLNDELRSIAPLAFRALWSHPYPVAEGHRGPLVHWEKADPTHPARGGINGRYPNLFNLNVLSRHGWRKWLMRRGNPFLLEAPPLIEDLTQATEMTTTPHTTRASTQVILTVTLERPVAPLLHEMRILHTFLVRATWIGSAPSAEEFRQLTPAFGRFAHRPARAGLMILLAAHPAFMPSCGASLTIVGAAMSNDGRTPQLNSAAPSSCGETTSLNVVAPSSCGETTSLNIIAPSSCGETTSLNIVAPSSCGTTLLSCGETPSLNIVAPSSCGTTLLSCGETLSLNMVRPHNDKRAHPGGRRNRKPLSSSALRRTWRGADRGPPIRRNIRGPPEREDRSVEWERTSSWSPAPNDVHDRHATQR
jgi:hypothetical protein